MMRGDSRPRVLGVVGGIVLTLLALGAAGAGHGTYLPIAVFGAPFSLLSVTGGILGTLVMWPAIGIMTGFPARGARRCAMWGLLVHDAAAVAIGSGLMGSPLADRGYTAEGNAWGILSVGLFFYVLVQVGLWSCLRDASHRDRAAA